MATELEDEFRKICAAIQAEVDGARARLETAEAIAQLHEIPFRATVGEDFEAYDLGPMDLDPKWEAGIAPMLIEELTHHKQNWAHSGCADAWEDSGCSSGY